MEKIYKVQMNSKGAPDFSTAVEIADRPSMEWKEDKDGQIRCTNCGRAAEWNFFEDEYCPRCGAKRED